MKWIGALLLLIALLVLVNALVPGERRDAPDPHRADRPSPGQPPDFAADASHSAGRACIFGTVRRAGRPVVGRVTARSRSDDDGDDGHLSRPLDPGPALAVAESDEAGRFEIPGLPDGAIGLTITDDDGAVGQVTAWIPRPGLRVRADLVIPSGPHSFSGRAAWADGRPFRGLVALATYPHQAFDYGGTETGPDGRFTITGLKRGIHRVCTLSGETPFRTFDRSILIPFNGHYEFIVDRDLHEWTGRVTAAQDGSPIVGAKLEISGERRSFSVNWTHWTEALTDEKGRFSFLAPRRSVGVTAGASGYLDTVWSHYEDGETIEFRLDRAASVSGVVIGAEDGKPVAGVPIYHRYGPTGVVTDTKGRFRIQEAACGHRVVFARGNGWVSPELAQSRRIGNYHDYAHCPLLLPLTAGRTTEVELTVVRAVRVEGQVVDANGDPVAGARVDAEDATPQRTTTFDRTDTATNQAGRFVFDDLVPGIVYEFSADAPGLATGYGGPLSGSPGERHEVTIRIPKPGEANLVVRDRKTGTPVPEARVRGVRGFLDWRGGLTDADGRVRLGPLGPRPWKIKVEHADYQPLEQTIHEEDLADEVIVSVEPGASISGVVVFPDGSPAESGTVSLYEGEETITYESLGFSGRFELRGLPLGEYELRASARGNGRTGKAKVPVTLPADGLRITVMDEEETSDEPDRYFTVRVLGPDGEIIPSVRISFLCYEEGEDEPVHEGYMSPERGLAEHLEPTWYESLKVTVWDARSYSGLPLPLGPAFTGLVPASRGELEVRLPPEQVVTGRVADAAGRGLPGVEVSAVPRGLAERGLYEDFHLRSTFTDPDGTFRLGGLGDFTVSIEVEAPYGFLPVEPAMARGGDQGLRLVVRRGATATVRVLDADGSPLPGAEVTTTDPYDRYWRSSAVADQHGIARLIGHDPEGWFTLSVDPPMDRSDLHARVIEDWSPADTEVRLPSGWLVRGVVLTADGQPVPEAVVGGRATDGIDLEATTGKFGGFEIGPFPAEGAEIYARPPGDCEEFWQDRWVPVEAGVSNLKLVLPPYGDLVIQFAGRGSIGSPFGILTAEQSRAQVGHRYFRNGRAVYSGLPADRTYTFFIEPDYKGKMVYVRGLRPGPDPVEVARSIGGTIRGSVVFPPGVKSAFLTVRGRDFDFYADVNEDGSFVIQGVPPGQCWVKAFLHGPDDLPTRTLKARAGDEIHFEFE